MNIAVRWLGLPLCAWVMICLAVSLVANCVDGCLVVINPALQMLSEYLNMTTVIHIHVKLFIIRHLSRRCNVWS